MAEADRVKWDAKYREESGAAREASRFLVALDALLPRRGRALDVAGGSGRNALWLAQRGLDVTLTDISEVGLGLARDEAARAGVALTTVAIDLERGALPAGPWDVIVCFHYLERSLFNGYPDALTPGGLLVIEHPTRSNLARHARPGARFLLDDGELPALVAGLEVVRYEEGWSESGRHEARLVARKR